MDPVLWTEQKPGKLPGHCGLASAGGSDEEVSVRRFLELAFDKCEDVVMTDQREGNLLGEISHAPGASRQ